MKSSIGWVLALMFIYPMMVDAQPWNATSGDRAPDSDFLEYTLNATTIINVDGDSSDWSGIDPLATDPTETSPGISEFSMIAIPFILTSVSYLIICNRKWISKY